MCVCLCVCVCVWKLIDPHTKPVSKLKFELVFLIFFIYQTERDFVFEITIANIYSFW